VQTTSEVSKHAHTVQPDQQWTVLSHFKSINCRCAMSSSRKGENTLVQNEQKRNQGG